MAFIPGIIIFITTVGLFILFLTAGLLIRDGLITSGTLVAFVFYVFMFYEPLISLVNFFTLVQNSITASGRIIQLLDETISIREIHQAIELDNIKGTIEYENINFEYEKDNPVLKNINISIKEKERLALVGYTGAGKSTFIKLLSRFYDPIEGNIKIDGINKKTTTLTDNPEAIGINLPILSERTPIKGKLKATSKALTVKVIPIINSDIPTLSPNNG